MPLCTSPQVMLSMERRGLRLDLWSGRALFLPDLATLVVADPHFGKAAHFRAAGIPVPEEVTDGDLARLTGLLDATGAARLVVLGDLLHAAGGMTPDVHRRLRDWRVRHARLSMVNVRGNHDRRAGDPPADLGFACVDTLREGPWGFAHEPAEVEGAELTLAGHLHPGVRLEVSRAERVKLPCFWFAGAACVAPAFSRFTGLAIVRPTAGDAVYAVTPEEVFEVAPRLWSAERRASGRRGRRRLERA